VHARTQRKEEADAIEGLVTQFNWAAMGISSKNTNRLSLPRPEMCLFPPESAPELEPGRGAQIMHDLDTFGFAFGRSSSPASYKLGVGPTTNANANATSSPAAAAVVDPTNTAEPEPQPDAVKTETNDGPATHETFNFGFALGGHEDGTSASTTTTTTTSSSPAMFTLDIGPTTATPAAGAAPLFAAAAPVPSSASSANGGAEPFKLSFTPPSFETILASVPKKSADTKKRPVRSPRTRTAPHTRHRTRHRTRAREIDLEAREGGSRALMVRGNTQKKNKDEEEDPIAGLTKAFNWAALGITPDDTVAKLQRRLDQMSETWAENKNE
jgi:hypothetical protein